MSYYKLSDLPLPIPAIPSGKSQMVVGQGVKIKNKTDGAIDTSHLYECTWPTPRVIPWAPKSSSLCSLTIENFYSVQKIGGKSYFNIYSPPDSDKTFFLDGSMLSRVTIFDPQATRFEGGNLDDLFDGLARLLGFTPPPKFAPRRE